MSPADGRNNQTYDAAAVVVESLADGPLSGYQIARASGDRVVGHSQKWLYPLLYDLEGRGAISGEWRVTPTGMRRCYSLRGAAASRFAVWRRPSDEIAPPAETNAPSREAMPEPIAVYLDRMTRALDLPQAEVDAVRREIEGHFEDAAADFAGLEGGALTAAAERLMGDPREVAGAVVRARQGRPAFWKSIALTVCVAPAMIVLVAAIIALVYPVIRGLVEVGLRIVFMPHATTGTLPLDQRLLDFPIVVGAFLSGRFTSSRLFSTGSPKGPTAAAGVGVLGTALLAIPALTVPMDLDVLSGVVMAGIPLGFALGIITPARFRQGFLSVRGGIVALVLAVAVVGAPLDGVHMYSSPAGMYTDPSFRVTLEPLNDFDVNGWSGTVYVRGPMGFSQVCREALPATVTGWQVAAGPGPAGSRSCDAITPETPYVNWTIPMPQSTGRNWVLLVYVVDGDGTSHTVAAGVAIGTPYRGSIIEWLTGRPGR